MKFANALAIIFSSLLLQVALLPNAVAAEQGAPAKAPEAAYDCKASKSNVPTCKRQVSQDARMQCRWRCSWSARAGSASRYAGAAARNATARRRRAGKGVTAGGAPAPPSCQRNTTVRLPLSSTRSSTW